MAKRPRDAMPRAAFPPCRQRAAARRHTAPRSYSAPQSRCNCRSPRERHGEAPTGRHRQKLRCSLVTQMTRRGGTQPRARTALHRAAATATPLGSGMAKRPRNAEAKSCFSALSPTGGGAEAHSPALVQRFTEPLQLPLPSRVAWQSAHGTPCQGLLFRLAANGRRRGGTQPCARTALHRAAAAAAPLECGVANRPRDVIANSCF
jgi:hypothetical protein